MSSGQLLLASSRYWLVVACALLSNRFCRLCRLYTLGRGLQQMRLVVIVVVPALGSVHANLCPLTAAAAAAAAAAGQGPVFLMAATLR